jgi:Leucine-rich repeat (LRR) protein
MKYFIALSVTVFLSCVSSITLECSFSTDFDGLYTCTDHTLNIGKNNEEIKEVKGVHFRGRTNDNVLSVYFMSSGMKRLPRGVFASFKNLKKYVVHGLDTVGEFLEKDGLIKGDFSGGKSLTSVLIMSVVLEQLRARVFEGAENLNYLTLEACRIETIDKDAFKGLKNLHSLGLKFNYITTLHTSTFSDLVMLQHLLMSGNYLSSITKDHIKSMTNINRISLIGNRLTDIDPSIIEGMSNLESIYLDMNPCVNEHFGTDGVPFSSFKKSIVPCTKEGSAEQGVVKLRDEIKDLEKEVASLQRLVEKYKSKNCGQMGMSIGGQDVMWMKRKATLKN